MYYLQQLGHDNTFFEIQPWELGKKCDGNFILSFAVAKVRYDGITTAKFSS